MDRTIIISCAGMGTRLGMGMPKALVDIHHIIKLDLGDGIQNDKE